MIPDIPETPRPEPPGTAYGPQSVSAGKPSGWPERPALDASAKRVVAAAALAAGADRQPVDSAYLWWALLADKEGPHRDLWGYHGYTPWKIREWLRERQTRSPEAAE